mgnify:CR=1 FL=1
MVAVEGAFKYLHPTLKKVLPSYGYLKPTPIQEKAIPVVLGGHHVVVIGPTGSGKTEAALFPVYSKILEKGLNGSGQILVLYITPLRALNRDIWFRMSDIAKAIGLKMAIRHGDTPQSERARIVRNPPDILITTPETFQFLLVGRKSREILRGVRWVIVDELHELIDNKRGVQLTIGLERLLEITGRRFQRIGLSATIGDIDLAKNFLGGGFRYVEVVYVELSKGMNIVVDFPTPSEEDELLSQEIETTPQTAARIRRIIELIRSRKGSLVFTNTRDMAEFLSSKLHKLLGDAIKVHHGSLSASERITAEKMFKEGLIKALVCTSSLELGIDIGHVDLVIQYMSPRQATKLLQRVGRSGHRLDKISKGYIIAFDSFDDIIESAVLARRAMRCELENPHIHENAFDVLAHQIIGIVLERGIVDIDYIYSVIKRAYPYRDLPFSDLMEVIKQLSSQGLIKVVNGSLKPGYGSWKYYYETSMIPDVKHYKVRDIVTNTFIGDLDEEFVAYHCSEGSLFILSGRVWKVVSIDHEKHIVNVEPLEKAMGILPAWEGDLIPVDYKVAREVAALRRRIRDSLSNVNKLNEILSQYPLTSKARERIIKVISEHVKKNLPVPTDKDIVFEGLGKIVVVHAALGSNGCQLLGIVLSFILSKKLGCSVAYRSDPYRVLLVFPYAIDPKYIASTINELAKYNHDKIMDLIREAIPKTRIYKWRLLHVAMRFGVIRKDVDSRYINKVLDTLTNSIIGKEALKEVLVDKLDLNALIKFLSDVKLGKLKVHIVSNRKEPLPITKESLMNMLLYDIVAPAIPFTVLIQLIKKRLLSKRVRLLCIMCGKWSITARVGELPDRINCPKCGSGLVTVIRHDDVESEKIVKKYLRRIKLSDEESRKFKELKDKAYVVLTYGKVGVIALSAHGVGPKTALRIAGKYYESEEAFYRAILEAERQYIRTRQYWH